MLETAAKRERILQTAEALFLDLGVDRTTLSKVGKASGAAVASVTNFFGKKPDLAAAVLDRVVARLADDAKVTLMRPGATAGDHVRALLATYTKWSEKYEHYRRLIAMLETYLLAEGRRRGSDLQERLTVVLVDWAKRRGPTEIAPLSPSQLYAVMLAPALSAGMSAAREAPAAAEENIDWLDLLTAVALAAVTPRKIQRSPASKDEALPTKATPRRAKSGDQQGNLF